jgi:hypothetical protein
MSVD